VADAPGNALGNVSPSLRLGSLSARVPEHVRVPKRFGATLPI